jgi:hypothetical protein
VIYRSDIVGALARGLRKLIAVTQHYLSLIVLDTAHYRPKEMKVTEQLPEPGIIIKEYRVTSSYPRLQNEPGRKRGDTRSGIKIHTLLVLLFGGSSSVANVAHEGDQADTKETYCAQLGIGVLDMCIGIYTTTSRSLYFYLSTCHA